MSVDIVLGSALSPFYVPRIIGLVTLSSLTKLSKQRKGNLFFLFKKQSKLDLLEKIEFLAFVLLIFQKILNTTSKTLPAFDFSGRLCYFRL